MRGQLFKMFSIIQRFKTISFNLDLKHRSFSVNNYFNKKIRAHAHLNWKQNIVIRVLLRLKAFIYRTLGIHEHEHELMKLSSYRAGLKDLPYLFHHCASSKLSLRIFMFALALIIFCCIWISPKAKRHILNAIDSKSSISFFERRWNGIKVKHIYWYSLFRHVVKFFLFPVSSVFRNCTLLIFSAVKRRKNADRNTRCCTISKRVCLWDHESSWFSKSNFK